MRVLAEDRRLTDARLGHEQDHGRDHEMDTRSCKQDGETSLICPGSLREMGSVRSIGNGDEICNLGLR